MPPALSMARRISAQRIAYGRVDNAVGASRPLVSVILPALNAAAYLDRAIESVLGQSYSPLELIVVDDGSDDGTPGVIARYRGRIRSVRQSRGGVSTARNRGIDLARGSLVAFIDADDEWELIKVDQQVAALRASPEAVVVLNGVRRLGAGRDAVAAPRAGSDLLITLLVDSMVLGPPSAMLVTRDALRTSGPFDPALAQGEDWDLLIRLAMVGPFVIITEPLTRYRVHAANASGDLGRAERDNRRVLERAFLEPTIAREYGRVRCLAISNHHLRFFLQFLVARDPARALRCLVRATAYRPLALLTAPWLVGRMLVRRIIPGR